MLYRGGNRTVLVVDDEEGVRLFVRAIMEQEGWVVEEAAHGEDALDQIAAQAPDLVILDLDMPVLDGFQTFARLRDDPLTTDIPIIVLTGVNEGKGGAGYDAESLELAFEQRRPEGFVEKPVDAAFLRQSVFGALG